MLFMTCDHKQSCSSSWLNIQTFIKQEVSHIKLNFLFIYIIRIYVNTLRIK